MIPMTKMENIVMNLTGCPRQIANTVVNAILEEDMRSNAEDVVYRIYWKNKQTGECHRGNEVFTSELEQAYLKFAMSEYEDDFDKFLAQYYQLMQLKNYIMTEYSFWNYEASSKKEDYIIYKIDEKTLDIWLQDHYNFVTAFLLRVHDNPWALFDMLNDRYFGYHFTNIFDEIAYDMKKEKLTNDGTENA